MRLTAGKLIEFYSIKARINPLYKEANSGSNIFDNIERVRRIHHEELNAYKIRMEILFSETDAKEQLNIFSCHLGDENRNFWCEISQFFYL